MKDKQMLPVRIIIDGKQMGEDQQQELVYSLRPPLPPRRCRECLQLGKDSKCKLGRTSAMGQCFEPAPPKGF